MTTKTKSKSELESKLHSLLAENPELKDQLKKNPSSFIKDKLGVELPKELTIKLVEFDKNELVLTLPNKSQAGDELNEKQLDQISGGTFSNEYSRGTPG